MIPDNIFRAVWQCSRMTKTIHFTEKKKLRIFVRTD